MNLSAREIDGLRKAVAIAHHSAKHEVLVCGLAGLLAPVGEEAIPIEGEDFLWTALKQKALAEASK